MPARRELVLVVDDEPRMTKFIRMNLELEGYQVVEIRSNTLNCMTQHVLKKYWEKPLTPV